MTNLKRIVDVDLRRLTWEIMVHLKETWDGGPTRMNVKLDGPPFTMTETVDLREWTWNFMTTFYDDRDGGPTRMNVKLDGPPFTMTETVDLRDWMWNLMDHLLRWPRWWTYENERETWWTTFSDDRDGGPTRMNVKLDGPPFTMTEIVDPRRLVWNMMVHLLKQDWDDWPSRTEVKGGGPPSRGPRKPTLRNDVKNHGTTFW